MFMAQRAFTMRPSSLLPLATFALTALLGSPPAQAAPAEVAPVGTPFSLVGSTFNGQGFDLAKQKGRVVMVFYWSTRCAVCRDKLPELRANLLGWKDKPFELVTVSVDRLEADWRQYEQIQFSTQAAASRRSVALWSGSQGFRHGLGAAPMKLPLTLVIDAEGKVRQRVEGRMAPEAWDLVADLLP